MIYSVFGRIFNRSRLICIASLLLQVAFWPAMSMASDFVVGTSTTQDAMALMIHVDPAMQSDQAMNTYLGTVFCDQMAIAANEFDRRDIAKRITETTRELARGSSGVATNVSVIYQLNEYDFERGGFPVIWAGYGWQNARPIFDMLGANRHCWRGAGSIGGLPSTITFFPEGDQVRRFVLLPEDKAREFSASGRPRYRLSFDLVVKRVGAGPMGTPRWNWSGEMRNVRAALVAPNGSVLTEIQNDPSHQEVAAATKAKCVRDLAQLKAVRDNLQREAADQERTFGDWAACSHAPKARTAFYDYRDALQKCAGIIDDFDGQLLETNTGIAASEATIARSCPRQSIMQPPPPDPRADTLQQTAPGRQHANPSPTPPTQGKTSSALIDRDELKRVLERARDEAGMPKDISEQAVGRCLAETRTRFPKSTNAYVAATCSCIGGKLKRIQEAAERAQPNDRKTVFERGFKAEMINCGIATLSSLNGSPDVLGPMREEVISACRSRPSDFKATLPEDAVKVCTCIYDRMLRLNRPQMIMWKHLGADAAIQDPMKSAVTACNHNKPVARKDMPFTGIYFPFKRTCDQSDEKRIDEIFTVSPDRVSGYEYTCRPRKIVQDGNVFTTDETCVGQGETWKNVGKYEVVDTQTIRLGVGTEGTNYYKCQ